MIIIRLWGQGGRYCFLSQLSSESNSRAKERSVHIAKLLYVVLPLPAPPEMQRKVGIKCSGPGGLRRRQTRALKEVWYLFWLKDFTGRRERAQIKRWHVWAGRKAALPAPQPRQGYENNGRDLQLPNINS